MEIYLSLDTCGLLPVVSNQLNFLHNENEFTLEKSIITAMILVHKQRAVKRSFSHSLSRSGNQTGHYLHFTSRMKSAAELLAKPVIKEEQLGLLAICYALSPK